jgi:hypothetical protein
MRRRRGSSVVRSVARHVANIDANQRTEIITTSALARIAGGNWAAQFATITSSFDRNCSIRSFGPRWSAAIVPISDAS